VPFNLDALSNADVLVTGELGFIGSALARRLVALGAKVTLVDSLIPEHGGNLFNVHDIRDQVIVDLNDVRDAGAIGDKTKRPRLFV
jgi:UDP-glucose 4-epimerase